MNPLPPEDPRLVDRRILALAAFRVAPLLAAASFALGAPLPPLLVGLALSLLSYLSLAATVDRLLAASPQALRPRPARAGGSHLLRLAAAGIFAVLFGRDSLPALATFLAGLAAVPVTLAVFGSLGTLSPAAGRLPGSVSAA